MDSKVRERSPSYDEEVIQGNPPKRARKNHSFMEYQSHEHPGDWLVDPKRSSSLIIALIVAKGFDRSSSIFLPGSGISWLPKMLLDNGFKNLTVVDLEEESINVQRGRLFGDGVTSHPTITICQCDVLSDEGLSNLIPRGFKFDIVVDKSFMDVFLRQQGVKKAWKETSSVLKEGGLFISISMFHAKWKALLSPKKGWEDILYGELPIKRFSRTRPGVASFSAPLAVFCAIRSFNEEKPKRSKSKKDQKFEINDVTFSDFHSIPKGNFPNDAASF